MLRYKLVWIQHGIILNNVDFTSNKYRTNADYFVTSTKGEYNEVTQDRYLYEKEDVLLTGLSRFDELENDSKNIISVIPTWRAFLSGKILGTGFHETKANFEESDYYKNYSRLLTDKKLINLIAKKKFTLQFILHPGMAGYEDYFKKFENDNIKIIPIEKVNYKKIFSQSKLLITDYSSILFDFAYLKKPVIFFQFDKDEFFSKHYKKGYFDYSKDGFGDVIEDCNSLVRKIKYYFITKFQMERKYIDRVDKTFMFHDRNNSKRLIDFLKGIEK
jgi:CDP-glycerol glycerophosphotransferase (TagB/SpsB family)